MKIPSRMVDTYECRRRINQASRAWATRDGQPWTDEDDSFLLEYWIDVEARDRDEITVSQCLERTVEACRVRCEIIRRRLGIGRVTVITTVVRETSTCPDCFEVRSANGECWCT